MKKILLLSSMVVLSLAANAQYSLSGFAPYTQNFDAIGAGLPTGWNVYSGASMTFGGTLETFSGSTSYGIYNDTTCATSAVVGGGFKNYASANAVTAGTSCTLQQSETNRAMGVRQVSPSNATHPNLDSGASFQFQIANTGGISALGCTFKLQSLDTSSPRVTTWRLQYKIGAAGTWTGVTPTSGTMTTGGHVFSNNTITASFGSALDNLSSNVYFRIVTIDFSSGTGNRPSTAIDDFNLTWTGKAGINDVASQGTLPLSVTNASTSAIGFNFDAEDAGNYSIVLTDMVGRKVATQNVDVVHGNQNVAFNGLSLTPGMYIAKISNGVTSGITKVIVQ